MVLVAPLAELAEDAVKTLQDKPFLIITGFIFLYVLQQVSDLGSFLLWFNSLSDLPGVHLRLPTFPREACPRSLVGPRIEITSDYGHIQKESVSIRVRFAMEVWKWPNCSDRSGSNPYKR